MQRMARMMHAPAGAWLIRMYPPDPPNSRSILRLQKNGADAENRAVTRADTYADTRTEHRAEPFAGLHAVACADTRAVVRAERFAESCAEKIPHFR